MDYEEFVVKESSNSLTYRCADLGYKLVKAFIVTDGVASEYVSTLKESLANKEIPQPPDNRVFNAVKAWVIKKTGEYLTNAGLTLSDLTEAQRDIVFDGLCQFVLHCLFISLQRCDELGNPGEVVYLCSTEFLTEVDDDEERLCFDIMDGLVFFHIHKELVSCSNFIVVNVEKTEEGITYRINATHKDV